MTIEVKVSCIQACNTEYTMLRYGILSDIMLGYFSCLYSPSCYLMVQETTIGLEHIINMPPLLNVPCSPVIGPTS